MDTLKTIGVAAVVALVVAGGLVMLQPKPTQQLGSVPGVALFPTSVTTFTQGGGITATTTAGAAATLVATDMDTENVIEVNNGTPSATITLPATSTLSNFAPNPGDMRTVWIRNASTSAASAFTLAVGTGMTLKNGASSTPLLNGDTDADNTFRVDFIRKSDTDMNVYLFRYQD
jgi:hypothetical protein